MRRILAISLLAALLAAPASAACYADYKAKKDNPLRLHYGVIELPNGACNNAGRAQRQIARRIAGGGWTLLNIVSFFGDDGLSQRRASAGDFFLRF